MIMTCKPCDEKFDISDTYIELCLCKAKLEKSNLRGLVFGCPRCDHPMMGFYAPTQEQAVKGGIKWYKPNATPEERIKYTVDCITYEMEVQNEIERKRNEKNDGTTHDDHDGHHHTNGLRSKG